MPPIFRPVAQPFAFSSLLVALIAIFHPAFAGASEKKEEVAEKRPGQAEPLFQPAADRSTVNVTNGAPATPSVTAVFPAEMKIGRSRRIALNAKIAHPRGFAVGDAIELNLFEGREHVALVDHVSVNANGTLTLRARVEGSAFGYVLFTTTDGQSLGSISIPETGEDYRVQPAGEYGHYLGEVHESGDPPWSCEAMIPPPPDAIEQQSIQGPDVGPMAEDPMEPVTIDVMIVYTPAARQWANASGGGIFNVIAQAMAKANLALETSDTFLSWNLVESAEIDYTESGNAQADLIRLTTSPSHKPFGNTWEGYPVSGYMDEVHALRDAAGADLVALFASVQDTGGLAWVLNSTSGRPDWGFALTRVQQASFTFTHAHETGHNMGLHHHRDQTFQPGPGLYNYSAGWRWIGTDSTPYCSVMTYGSGAFFSDGRTHLGVGHFSNPAINHTGVSTGHSSLGDNARTLRETKHLVAAYRSRVAITIAEAVEQPEWEWASGGNGVWSVQALSIDGEGHAAQSGQISHEGESWLETTIEGPGTLQFWWKVSSERNFDFLKFYIGDEEGERDRIAGEIDWELKSYPIPPGSHTVRWVYEKDSSVTVGADAGWLDQVVWTPGPVEVSTFAQWRSQAQSPPGQRGIADDPGGVGIPNWHRYAFGLDPHHPERSGLPVVGIRSLPVGGVERDFLTISFSRSQAASDILYRPEASSDLVNWESLASVEFLVETVQNGNWHEVAYRDRVPIEDADSRFLRVGIVSFLGQAIGQPRRDWLTGGNESWVVQAEDVFSGGTSLRSGSILANQQSWVQTAFEGPGVISFWWRVSSEAGWDFLRFLVDDEELTSISGEVGWKERTFLLPEGSHTVQWRYSKDGTVTEGEDAGWLDQVDWVRD